MRRVLVLLAGAALLFMVGCASLNPFPKHVHSTPPSAEKSAKVRTNNAKTRPYTVLGRTYYPLQTAAGYDEVGVASWYGSDFHGKKTANGQTYNMYGLSAAHKTLPLGTRVRVTRLSNNASVVLVINDRGPFVSGRILDLSYGAAKELGMVHTGVSKVRISAIGSAPSRTVTAKSSTSKVSTAKRYHVRVGAFARLANAEHAHRNLVAQGYKQAFITEEQRDGLTLHIVLAGTFASRDQAEQVQERLKKAYPTCYIVS